VPELVEECDYLESAAPVDELDAHEIGVPLLDQWEELSSTGYEEAGCEACGWKREVSCLVFCHRLYGVWIAWYSPIIQNPESGHCFLELMEV
jgi:hypothetical protein